MAIASENPLPTPNSEQEYINGVADDGSNLTIVSRHLTQPYAEGEVRPPIGPHSVHAVDKSDSPHLLESDKKVLAAEKAHMERVRKCVRLYEHTVDLGEPAHKILAAQAELALLREQTAIEFERRKLERLKNTPIDQLVEGEEDKASGIAFQAMSGESFQLSPEERGPTTAGESSEKREPEGCEATSREARGQQEQDAPATHRQDGDATRKARTPRAPSGPREPRVRNVPFSAAVLLAFALKAAKELPKLSAELRDLESRLHPAEAEQKIKDDFFNDRAFCVVKDMLNSMDGAYKQLGFGHWMPFRFPDQWLMFTGIMNRVLAAHGLMHSANAATYKKLLDDTPPISPASADAGAPKSYGLCFRNREYKSMQHMLERLADVRAGRGPPL